MLKQWSDENADHIPVFVLMNTKDQKVKGTRNPLPFTKEAFDSLDKEILSVFSAEDLITPDFVRGDHESLEDAILTDDWPNLEKVKGRFLFVIDEKEEKIEPVYNLENALIEIIKYGSKIFTEPDLKKKGNLKTPPKIYDRALDNILVAMKGKRIFERFGFNLPEKHKSILTNKLEFYLSLNFV